MGARKHIEGMMDEGFRARAEARAEDAQAKKNDDTMSRRGATRLAHTIQRYWAEKGFDVSMTVTRARVQKYEPGWRGGRLQPANSEIYVVRSDMGPNGYPQRRRVAAIKYEPKVALLP